MPGLEGVASAFQSGLQSGGDYNRHRRERKELLSDEERQTKVADLYGQRNAIRDRIKKLGLTEGDPQYQEGMASLANIETSLNQIYHPVHAPGALAKDWDFLTGLITRRGKGKKEPVPGPDVPTPAAGPDVTVDPEKLISSQPTSTLPSVSAPPPAAPIPNATPAEAAQVPAPLPMATPAEARTALSNLQMGKPPADITLPSAPITVPGTTPPKVMPVAAETMAAPPDKVKGLVAPGNLTIWNRPTVRNDDGTVSSEYSTSFTDENPQSPYYGKEVLVPTVVNGKFLTPDGKKPPQGSDAEAAMFQKAMDNYKATGQHLGVFDDPKSADKYAQHLHSRGERGRPDAAAYEPKQTAYQRKLAAQADLGEKEARQFMASGPLTPEEEADAAVKGKIAGIKGTMSALDDLMGPDWDQDEREEVRQSFIHTALGLDTKEKYFSNLQTTVDPATGKTHVYRVPQKPGAMPEEIVFPGNEQFTGKGGADGTKGSDFRQAVYAKYGTHPTEEQWAAERARWSALGAHGTSTVSDTDASGRTVTRRVPIFMAPPSAGVRGQLGLTSLGAGGAGEAPVAGGGGGGAGGTGMPSSGGGTGAGPSGAGMPAMSTGDLNLDQEIDAVAHYRIPLSMATGAKGGQKTKFLAMVMQKNPNYNATKWEAAQKTVASFSPGGGDMYNLKSLGQGVGHLYNLAKAADALNNSSYPLINAKTNWGLINIGDARPTNFNARVNAVSGEMGTVFKGGTSATDMEIKSWSEQMNPNMSPKQMFGGIGTMVGLMASRMGQEAQSYIDGFGSLSGFPILSDENVKVLKLFANPNSKEFRQQFPTADADAITAVQEAGTDGANQILAINEMARAASGMPPTGEQGEAPAPAPAAPPTPAKQGAAKSAAKPAAAGSGVYYARDPKGQWYEVPKGTPPPAGYTIYAPN